MTAVSCSTVPVQRFAAFSGCVIQTQLPFIEKLAHDVFKELDIGLVDLDFTCCPFSGVRDADQDLWLAIAARNLSMAEKAGLPILSLCSGCFQTLKEAAHKLEDKDLRARINTRLAKEGVTYNGSTKVFHLMHVLDDNIQSIASKAGKRPGLRMSTHTGCHLLRPASIMGYDEPDYPVKFDALAAALGYEVKRHEKDTLCCGYTQITGDRQMSLSLMKDKVDSLLPQAELLAVCCPSCFLQFDRNQVLLKQQKLGTIHVLQLLAIAFGLDPYLSENRSLSQDMKGALQ